MKHSSCRNPALIVGLADGLVVIAFGIVVAAFDGTSPLALFTAKLHLVGAFLLPVAVIAGWRGAADATRWLNGHHSLHRGILEGFLLGFLIIPVSHFVGIVSETVAAGPAWPALGHSSVADWLRYFWYLIQVSTALGAIGATIAALVCGTNRMVLRRCANAS